MKWFHHECSARHDPKLQILGASFGAEGIGIYWGLLEEIGQHSDEFHLKISGISAEDKRGFTKFNESTEKSMRNSTNEIFLDNHYPVLPIKILAKNLFTTSKKLLKVIDTCVSIGLFDTVKWLRHNILYSPSFEQRADDYTRRIRRKSGQPPPLSEQNPAEMRTDSESSSAEHRSFTEKSQPRTETNTEGETDEEEKESLFKYTSQMQKHELPLGYEELKAESFLIDLDEKGFKEYSAAFHRILRSWNDNTPSRIDWIPREGELKKLFYGGKREDKLKMCYEAYNLLGEKINYPELVMRALKLMLKTTQKTRVANPFGWLWTCLHGNSNGSFPWVQLITAEEESSLTNAICRRSNNQ